MSRARRERRDAPAGMQPRGARPGRDPGRFADPRQWIAPVVIAGIAAVLLLWNLTDTYLWQDEANTAVMAVRLLQYGKPLAWDGRNLISDDNFAAQDQATIDQRTRDPQKAVQDCIRRGAMTTDGMWTYQPWGQFLVAGLGIALLGPTTFAARIPFALAGVVTVLALYWLVRRHLKSPLIAALASALLTINVYWLLHARQARYYALTSLFMTLTLIAYARWQQGARWGAPVFVATAWCWFQVDYGTVWPVLGVLFLDAFVRRLQTDWKTSWHPVVTGAALAALIAPFVFFYRLGSRQSGQLGTWLDRFKGTLFNINEYVVPVIVVLAALVLVVIRRHGLPRFESRLVVLGCAIILAMLLWVPTVAPMHFVRYVIMAAPVGALLTAWLCVRGLGAHAPRLAWAGIAVVALTPWLCEPLASQLPHFTRVMGKPWRVELSLIGTDIFGHRRDPNRIVVEWLREHAAPTDEILINYEDLPLIYYLPNLIRGGVVAFRAEDDRVTPPRFAIMRRTVPFVYWQVFGREIARYFWTPVPVKAPDIRWGNNPDPEGHLQDRDRVSDLLFFQRTDSSAAK